jgi:hypothetical protein
VECDRRFQPRESLSEHKVRQYARDMKRGDPFPPILLAKVGKKGPFVLDGFHRVEAARLADLSAISARIASMTEDTAVWAAIQANTKHGINLTRQDKRRCFQLFCEAGRHLRQDGTVKSLRALRAELDNIAHITTLSRWLKEAGIVPSEDEEEEPLAPWRAEEEQGPDLDEFDVQLHSLENTFQRLTDEDRSAAAHRLREVAFRLYDGEKREGPMALDI